MEYRDTDPGAIAYDVISKGLIPTYEQVQLMAKCILAQPPLGEFDLMAVGPDGCTVYKASHELWNTVDITFPPEYWRPDQPMNKVLAAIRIPDVGEHASPIPTFEYDSISEAERFMADVEESARLFRERGQ